MNDTKKHLDIKFQNLYPIMILSTSKEINQRLVNIETRQIHMETRILSLESDVKTGLNRNERFSDHEKVPNHKILFSTTFQPI